MWLHAGAVVWRSLPGALIVDFSRQPAQLVFLSTRNAVDYHGAPVRFGRPSRCWLSFAAAKSFINQNCSADDPAFINRLVLIETVWVLESVYEYSREQIAAAIETLLRMVRVLTEDADLVRVAVVAYRHGADCADALIAGVNSAKGCSRTATFDRSAAKKMPHLVALELR